MASTGQNGVLIAGVGNLLMRDDGVGVHAVRELLRDPPPGVSVLDAGTAILSALPFFENASRVLVIDAVRAGGRPGSIYLFNSRDADAEGRPASLHSVGPLDAVRHLGRGTAPDITVLGVEPAIVDYGTELSGTVKAALADVVETARRTVSEWCRAGMCETKAGTIA
jgi:hydrogenase maturation protease